MSRLMPAKPVPDIVVTLDMFRLCADGAVA